MSIDVTNLDATAQAELVRTGDVAALELVEAAIARIETTLNAKLNAVVIPLFERARAPAAAKLAPGPFRGVLVRLKDLVAASAGDPLSSRRRSPGRIVGRRSRGNHERFRGRFDESAK